MRFLPHTDDDIRLMLDRIGVKKMDDLLPTIPDDCRVSNDIDIPGPLSEWQLDHHMQEKLSPDKSFKNRHILIGAGSYSHHIPAIIPYLMGRSEFLTAYTPYQPEMAQGTLQGIFEYQTLTARLLGVDVVNASMYDGASALAEALLMSLRISRKRKK